MKLLGLCFLAFAASTTARNCGLKIAPCPSYQICVPKSSTCTNLDRCLGTCVTPTKPPGTVTLPPKPAATHQSCGGFVVAPAAACPAGQSCVDDPRIGGCGMACDRPGICAQHCAGFAGLSCPDGFDCYDYVADSCDPKKGGADCGGICVARE